ncbi:MAG: sodium-dependent transporter [Bacteroidales bacterium]|nr:sodium-dependent transporter [Bacteroidales bacterium]
MAAERENFGSRLAVIAAFAGSAIGLGNIWRFPYMAGEGGGAAFVVVFTLSLLVIALPMFLAESIIGRRSGSNCLGAMKKLAPTKGWKIFGLMSVFIPMFILSYYSVVGGWSVDFLAKAFTGQFSGDPDTVKGLFGGFVGGTWTPIIAFTVFLALSFVIPIFGVTAGIERFNKISIPVLFFVIVAIMIYSLTLPGAMEGVKYFVRPDFSQLTFRTVARAVGQSFYALSLGCGIIITYSSYISKKENLLVSGVGTAASGILFSVLAGLAIIPAVFAAGISPGAGPGLVFETVPFVFAKMGAGMPWVSTAVAILFFLTIVVAALTSSISMAEVGISFLVEEKHIKRGKAAAIWFAICWIVGGFIVLSFGPLSHVRIFGLQVFSFVDMTVSNFLMMICGILGVIFVGWIMKRDDVKSEFLSDGSCPGNRPWFRVFYFLVRYIAPIAILFIFICNFL